MTTGLSTANLANRWLDMLRGTAFTAPAAVYAKLHTADPGAAGATAASVVTTRSAITWSAASAGAIVISNTPTWTGAGIGTTETVTHVSLWDAPTAGNFLGSGVLSTSKTWANTDVLNLTGCTVSVTPLAA